MGIVYGSYFQEGTVDYFEQVFEYTAVPSLITGQAEITINWDSSALSLEQSFAVYYSFQDQLNFTLVTAQFSIIETVATEELFYVKVISGKRGAEQYPTLNQVNFSVVSYQLDYSRFYFEINAGIPYMCFTNASGLKKITCSFEQEQVITEDEFLILKNGKITIEKNTSKLYVLNRFFDTDFKKRNISLQLQQEVDLLPAVTQNIFIAENKIYFRLDNETTPILLSATAI